MIHYAPPGPLDAFRPRLEPRIHGVGPGPLSPAWPRPKPAPPPANEWDEIDQKLSAIRRDIAHTLRPESNGMPFFLGLEERRVIEAAILALKRAHAELPYAAHRPSEIAGWPTPVLPTNVFFGARDVLPILDTAIRAAASASERATWFKDRPWHAASL